jgi:chromosome segregation ATPase
MFQDELQKLQVRIVEYQEQVSLMERHTQDLGSQIAGANDRAEKATEELKRVEAERDRQASDLSDARRVAERAEHYENENGQLAAQLKKATEHLALISENLSIKNQQARALEAQLNAAKTEIGELKAKLEPTERLIFALKTRVQADDIIRESLEVLSA